MPSMLDHAPPFGNIDKQLVDQTALPKGPPHDLRKLINTRDWILNGDSQPIQSWTAIPPIIQIHTTFTAPDISRMSHIYLRVQHLIGLAKAKCILLTAKPACLTQNVYIYQPQANVAQSRRHQTVLG